VNDETFPSNYIKHPPYKSFIFGINIIQITIMSLISILLVLIFTGAILWLINTYVPMDTTIKNVFNSLIVIVTIIWILNAFALFSS
jgi:hypothetical protein